MAKRAVLYARVSSDDRGKEGRNLAGQIEMCREYATAQGYYIVAELAEDDRGARGSLFDLEKLNQARRMAKSGDFDVLVVREIDRFARSLAKQLIVEEELKRAGVEVDYVLGEYPDTPEGNLNKNIKAVIAEYEAMKITERTSRARWRKVKEGSVMVHGVENAPYGYRVIERDHKKRELQIYEPEAEFVRMIFDWYVYEGMPFRQIAEKLTGMGVPTPRPQTRRWSRSTVSVMIRNETYAGTWHYGKWNYHRREDGTVYRTKNEDAVAVDVPSIVNRETWKQAQETCRDNRSNASRQSKRRYLLRVRVTCGNCGSKMNGQARQLGKLYKYYRCPAAQRTRRYDYARRCTNRKAYRADKVDAAVWEWIKRWLCHPEQLANGLRAYQAQQEQENAPLTERLSVVNDLLASNRAQLERVLDLYLAGDFPAEMIADRKTRLEITTRTLAKERETLIGTLEAQRLTEDQIRSIIEFAQEIHSGLERADGDFDWRRHIIELLDVRVTLVREDGQQVIYAQCVLGKDVLSVTHKGA